MLTRDDMHEYQRRCANALYEQDALYLVAPVGAGKTAIALTATQDMHDDEVVTRSIIIAPKNVAKNVWPNEPGQWSHLRGIDIPVCLGTPKQRTHALQSRAPIVAATFDNLQWLTEQPEWRSFDHLVIDEASKIKAPSGKRTKALYGTIGQFSTIWGMSGTPSAKPWELYNQAKVITRGAEPWGKSYWKWQKKHFWQDQHTYKLHPKRGEQTIDQIMQDFADIAVRVDDSEIPRTAEDVPIINPFTLSPEERKHYREMEKDFLTLVSTGTAIASPNAAVVVNKLRQITSGTVYETESDDGGPKSHKVGNTRLEALVELLESIGDEPVLVPYQFRFELEELRQHFGYLNPRFIGAGAKEVGRTIEMWNAGELPLLLVHPASAGHGLNLQYGPGHRVVWYGLPWSLEHYQQTNGRLSRQGQKRQVYVHHLIDPSTIDQKVYDALQGKKSFQDAVIGKVELA